MIFDWFRGRNFGAKRTYSCKKAMREYKKEHPLCEITGKKRGVQTHHIYPVWRYPELADNPKYFIRLHKKWHFILAHFGNYKKFNINIKEDSEIWKQKIT